MITLIASRRQHKKIKRLQNEGRFDPELTNSGAGMICRLLRDQTVQVVISLKD